MAETPETPSDNAARIAAGGGWIHTFTGKKFTPLNPKAEQIDVRDIAHALAMQARWNGHTRVFYSVAEHSVRVSLICPAKEALWGLMHDASEAYLKDIPSPVKNSQAFEPYRDAEALLMAVIAERFGLPYKEPQSVKRADAILLHTEARDLFPAGLNDDWRDEGMAQPRRINPLTWQGAEQWFMQRFRQLEKRTKAAA